MVEDKILLLSLDNIELYIMCEKKLTAVKLAILRHTLKKHLDTTTTDSEQYMTLLNALTEAQIEENNKMKPTETKELPPMKHSTEELVTRYVLDCVAQEKKHNYGQQETLCYYDEKAQDVLLDFLMWEKDRAAWLATYEKQITS